MTAYMNEGCFNCKSAVLKRLAYWCELDGEPIVDMRHRCASWEKNSVKSLAKKQSQERTLKHVKTAWERNL